jgi:hypothetical protein
MDVLLHQTWDVYSERAGVWRRGLVILIEFGVATIQFDRPLDLGHYDIVSMTTTPDRSRLVRHQPIRELTAPLSFCNCLHTALGPSEPH